MTARPVIVRRVAAPALSWTVVDAAGVIAPVERFLAHLAAVERSPNTVRAYAHDLRDFFEFLGGRDLPWHRVRLEDVGRFVAWLRLPPPARAGSVGVLPSVESTLSAATVNRKLSALSSFYEFHQRHGVDVGELLTRWRPGARSGGSWQPLLAHLGSRPERQRVVGLRTERRIPHALDDADVERLLAACDTLRDRLLLTLLREAGLRIGEALGLRHEDIDARRGEIAIVARENANGARAKSWDRRVPVSAATVRLYSDYLHIEYGTLDSDYVFVVLTGARFGFPSTIQRWTAWCAGYGPAPVCGSRRTSCGTPTRPSCCVEAWPSRWCRSCWVTPRSRRRSTLTAISTSRTPAGRWSRPASWKRSCRDGDGAWSCRLRNRADDWLTRVRRALRVEFAGDVILAVAGGPALMGRSCIVDECRRLAHHGGFCEAHHKRWTADGRPEIEEWVATAPARSKGLRSLRPCDAPGCRRGRTGAGMCQTHELRWRRAGCPELAGWLATGSGPAVEPAGGVSDPRLRPGGRRPRRVVRLASQASTPRRLSADGRVHQRVRHLPAGQVRSASSAAGDAGRVRLRAATTGRRDPHPDTAGSASATVETSPGRRRVVPRP